jgi:hypothetical protein
MSDHDSGKTMFDDIFGAGTYEATRAAEAEAEAKAREYATKVYTPSGVIKGWMISLPSGHLGVELSELGGMGWEGTTPPDRVTVASGPDTRHVYRLAQIDHTPDGDVGAWTYEPNCPEQAPWPQLHIFND